MGDVVPASKHSGHSDSEVGRSTASLYSYQRIFDETPSGRCGEAVCFEERRALTPKDCQAL